MKLAHRKRDMVIHCRKPDNKACLDMVSESGDLQQMEWIRRLASEDHCPCCEQDLGIVGNMSSHLEKPDNATCLQYTGKSGNQELAKIFEKLTAEGLILACPCCCQ